MGAAGVFSGSLMTNIPDLATVYRFIYLITTSHRMASFNQQDVRRQFPALQQPEIFFDNAGRSQTLGTVIKSITSYLSHSNVQLGGSYNASQRSSRKYHDGHNAAAKYINASPDNIVLGASATQLLHNLSHALRFPAGSELLVSSLDHECNITPWVELAKRQSLVLKWWTPTLQRPRLLASDLQRLLTARTVLVTCTHASNILGTIHDIKAITDAVHEIPGALICVDGVAYAPHRPLDMQALGVDFYSFSWYKVFGPHMALLYASVQGLNATASYNHFFNPASTLSDKLGLAGSSYELLAAIPAVVEYFGHDPATAWAMIQSHEFKLQRLLLKYLNSRSDISICGEENPDCTERIATISFLVHGRKSQEVVEKIIGLSGGKMGIRWGCFYSVRLLRDLYGLGQDGVIRVSMVHYNTGKVTHLNFADPLTDDV
ncbi:Aminotransferase-like protein [Podosphaera aphanis]|nr:Aminotransferase-like protein [Podosphaera aphanis]